MILLFVFGFILFISLVLVHEWGHFIAAKKNGVHVEEFGLGFPPKAKSLGVYKGTEYTINWLPLGGFVRLKGEHDAATQKHSFGAASLKTKVTIMLAGVFMNLVVAYALFVILALVGLPNLTKSLGFEQYTVASDTKISRDYENKGVIKVGSVVDQTPASIAGFKEDDQIVSINNIAITTPEILSEQTKLNAGTTVPIVTKRENTQATQNILLRSESPYLGVSSYSDEYGIQVRRSTWSAPIVAAGVMKDFTKATLNGLWTAVQGLGSIVAGTATGNSEARKAGQTAASSQVAGPVGIVQTLYQGARLGVTFMLFIIAIISLTLAIMNVLPIPALDGGRMYTLLLFRLFRKKLTMQTEERIQLVGMGLVLVLIALTTFVDISRITK